MNQIEIAIVLVALILFLVFAVPCGYVSASRNPLRYLQRSAIAGFMLATSFLLLVCLVDYALIGVSDVIRFIVIFVVLAAFGGCLAKRDSK